MFAPFKPTPLGASARALAAGLGAAAIVTLTFAPGAGAISPEDGFAAIAAKAMPAYVDIATTQTVVANRPGPEGGPFDEFFRDFFDRFPNQGGQSRQVQAEGSGFLIDPSGIVVTNNHVIDGAEQVRVILQDGTALDAVVLGVDDRADLAVLKVDAGHDLPYLPWGDSDLAYVGDWTVAIGNPFGLGGTMTAGIISARARNINAGPYDDFIQTDASINRGNSGGPLINVDGKVIGINTAIFSPTGASIGLGFAIPSNLARPIINQIIEYGRPRRGWLGVRIQTVTEDLAQGLGLDSARGALIAGVSPDGPAGAAGIEPGDVILRFNGNDITDVRRLPRVVAEAEVDSTVPVELWRDGELKTVDVRVGELTEVVVAALADQPEPGIGQGPEILGMTLTALTPDLREEYGLEGNDQGVLVTGVAAQTAAAQRSIRPGDVILEVAQQEVRTPEEVSELVEQSRQLNRSTVLVLLRKSDGDLRWVALSLGRG